MGRTATENRSLNELKNLDLRAADERPGLSRPCNVLRLHTSRERQARPLALVASVAYRHFLILSTMACSRQWSRPIGIQLASKTAGSMTSNCRSTLLSPRKAAAPAV